MFLIKIIEAQIFIIKSLINSNLRNINSYKIDHDHIKFILDYVPMMPNILENLIILTIKGD